MAGVLRALCDGLSSAVCDIVARAVGYHWLLLLVKDTYWSFAGLFT